MLFTGFSNFVSASFAQGCGKPLKQNVYSYGWVLYIKRMVKQMFWSPNSEMFKFSNLTRGRWLVLNGNYLTPYLKEKQFFKNFSYSCFLYNNGRVK